MFVADKLNQFWFGAVSSFLGYFFQNKLVAVSVAHYFETLHLESDVRS
jgi:hypothetical protein